KEGGRRVEHARLSVREPWLARPGKRIPQRNLSGAQPVRRVQLQRIEEVALIPKRGGKAPGERGSEPEESRRDCRSPEKPGQPRAQRHPGIVSGREASRSGQTAESPAETTMRTRLKIEPPQLADRWRPLGIALAIFVVAFLVRISNLPTAFHGGVPQLAPFDELYHAKRIVYSATHLFRVLTEDPNRGPRGAFCPWPPLYDMLAGAFFGIALTISLLVQPALLLAGGIVLIVVLWLDPGKPLVRAAAASGFALSSLLIFLYRAVQPAGYPDSEWYLGASHAAALAG